MPLFKYLPLISNFNDNNLSLFLVEFPIFSLTVPRFQAYYDNYFYDEGTEVGSQGKKNPRGYE